MNHTIVTLDERAKDYAAMELATVNPGGIEEFNRLYRNKFAELIVRECEKINSGFLGHSTWAVLHNLYSEHFGVEK